jgi:hypothetical protein
MEYITRRKFLQFAAGATVGRTMVGNAALFQSAAGNSENICDRSCLPLKRLIFPEPQDISASGSDFRLDKQVRIIVPTDASEEDLLLAKILWDEVVIFTECI